MDKNKTCAMSLKGMVIDASELVSMIVAQTKGESKDVLIFADKIIDLIYSHSKAK